MKAKMIATAFREHTDRIGPDPVALCDNAVKERVMYPRVTLQ